MGRKRDSIKGWTVQCYIKVDGEQYHWYDIKFLDDDGDEQEVTWYLPEEKTEEYVRKMLDNIGKKMSDYIYCNPNCSLVKSIMNSA